jgi:hypothetical protein
MIGNRNPDTNPLLFAPEEGPTFVVDYMDLSLPSLLHHFDSHFSISWVGVLILSSGQLEFLYGFEL